MLKTDSEVVDHEDLRLLLRQGYWWLEDLAFSLQHEQYQYFLLHVTIASLSPHVYS